MSSAEKKVAYALVIVLVVMVVAYFATGKSEVPAADADSLQLASSGGMAGTEVCAPTSGVGPEGVPTQEFGKEGATLEIVAALPITHGCHVETEAELKKAHEEHPGDIHLIIYDLFGREGQEFVAQNGGQRALVFINGKSSFQLDGRNVKLEVREGGTYVPSDIIPIVEQELSKAG